MQNNIHALKALKQRVNLTENLLPPKIKRPYFQIVLLEFSNKILLSFFIQIHNPILLFKHKRFHNIKIL